MLLKERWCKTYSLRKTSFTITFYSVSYIKIMLWRRNTYGDDFIELNIYSALDSEVRINTTFKNTLTSLTESDISTKKLVLLPADWNENASLFTTWRNIINKTNGYIPKFWTRRCNCAPGSNLNALYLV